MTRFEELQQIWQSQAQDDAALLDIRGTTDALRRFGRRQTVINCVKGAMIAFQVWWCLSRLGVTLFSVAGEVLLVTGLAGFLLADWRAQMDIARLDFSSPSANFIDAALARMADPNAGYRQRLGLNLLLICVGYNMLVLSRTPTGAGLMHRLATQLGLTALLLVLTLTLGLKLHAKRCELEYRPIKKRLMGMKQAIEEQRQ